MNGAYHNSMSPPSSNIDAHAMSPTTASAVSAVDLIRQLDTAFAEVNSNIVTGARDAEAARKNARMASELARRFASGEMLESLSFRDQEEKIPVISRPAPPPPVAMNGDSSLSYSYRSPQKAINHKQNVASPQSSNSKQMLQPSTKSDRYADRNAEDLLQVTLELERSHQQLEEEQMRHDETKSLLQQAHMKNSQLEAQMEKLLDDMETAREASGRKIEQLEHELQQSQKFAVEANDDADQAYQIAEQRTAEKEAVEEQLGQMVQAYENLRAYAHSQEYFSSPPSYDYTKHMYDLEEDVATPEYRDDGQRHVRWGDQTDRYMKNNYNAKSTPTDDNKSAHENDSANNNPRPNRALVAAGRQVLHRAFSTDGTPISISQDDVAERRQRLRSRFERFGGLDMASSEYKSPSLSPIKSPPTAFETLEVCRNAAQILKESGTRLNLAGHWFANTTATTKDEVHLETLARQYASLVEVSAFAKKHDCRILCRRASCILHFFLLGL
jgi:3'-phosphoadenosine 5'-phosphosulfate sulfotransferase